MPPASIRSTIIPSRVDSRKRFNHLFAGMMKKTRCIVIAACVLIASCMLIVCCGVFASHRLFVEPLRLFVEWMGYETLPLAQNSSIPAFVGEISDVQELRRIEFCWSDLEFRPMAGMPHTRVSYLSTNGKVVMVKLPITETGEHSQFVTHCKASIGAAQASCASSFQRWAL